ncbi:TBC1 domain member 31 [Blyttiomyces sp. JEL0837]|nr:TBC1 domain member 31 [Blyttiomyces sp. JEL0837]
MPFKAEDGLARPQLMNPLSNETIGSCDALQDEFSEKDITALDAEGRVVITDHKLAVEIRLRSLLEQGRQVIIVGDFNVCHNPIDHCDPENSVKEAKMDAFGDTMGRRWMTSLLVPKGPMVDVFRHFEPTKRGAFTCWNTLIDGRKSNFGTRIDYIVCSQDLLPWFAKCTIDSHVFGSDHCPVSAYFHDYHPETGQSLRDAMGGISDTTRQPPQLCAKFWDEFSGQQQSLKDWFVKRTAPSTDEDTAPAITKSGSVVLENEVPLKKAKTSNSTSTKPKQLSISSFLQKKPSDLSDSTDRETERIAASAAAALLQEANQPKIQSEKSSQVVDAWKTLLTAPELPLCYHGEKSKEFKPAKCKLVMEHTAQGTRAVCVGDVKSGAIWSLSEWRKIVGGLVTKGTLLRIFNATPSSSRIVGPDGSNFLRPIPFNCVAVSREMSFGSSASASGPDAKFLPSYAFVLAAADQRGHIFALDIPKNKFWLVARTGVSATALAFNSLRRRELIVGLSDHSLHCYNIDTSQLVARLPAYHRSEPHFISVHPDKPLAISTSRTESILWNTERWERKRVLMGAGPPGVQQASFTPLGDTVITAFNDGSIILWDTDSFSIRWKISIERFSADQMEPFQDVKMLTVPRTSHLAVSKDGEYLAYVGLYIVAVLASSGDLLFVNAAEAKFIGALKGRHKFRSFSLSPDGYVMSLILLDAKYSIRMLRLHYLDESMVKLNSLSLKDNNLKKQTLEEDSFAEEFPPSHDDQAFSSAGNQGDRVTLDVPKVQTLHDLVEAKDDSKSPINRRKLLKFLKHYGAFPNEYRALIWRLLLKLPENRDAYEVLMKKGIHPCAKDFRKKFPLKSERLAKSMERVLSGLAFWSPIFEDLDYLPQMIFPFIKLFINDMFSAFEAVMTLTTEDMLAYHDQELLTHFVNCKVTSEVYSWQCFRNFFSENFLQNDWLKLWDHLVANPPAFIYLILVSYITSHRVSLLKISDISDFKFFFSRLSFVSVDHIILKAYRLQNSTPDAISPESFLSPFEALTVGQYPIFNKYPEFIVNYQSKMREKIRQDEQEYLRRRKIANEVTQLAEELQQDKMAWESADWKMNDMVEKWWESMIAMEDSHTERKARLDAVEKDQRIRALRRIAEARRSFLDHQSQATRQQGVALARAVGTNRRELESRLDESRLDKRFREVENEWLARREELLEAREELSRLDQARTKRLVANARSVGVPEMASGGNSPLGRPSNSSPSLDNRRWRDDVLNLNDAEKRPPEAVWPSETDNLRRVMNRRENDSPVSIANESPRSWSPELVEERRYRRTERGGNIASESGELPTRQEIGQGDQMPMHGNRESQKKVVFE